MSRQENTDLEALEFFVRNHMLQAGARALEALLEPLGRGRRREPLICGENHLPQPMRSLGVRAKTLRTILGPVRFERSAYVCPVCGKVRCPGDELLGVVRTRFSPGARRMMARTGARESFAEAAGDLDLLAALKVDAKDVERVAEGTGRAVEDWMAQEGTKARLAPPVAACEPPETSYVSFDGTGAPMRREELKGVKGKGPDGRARTKEVKLGCVFTQTALDEEGRPVRDPDSTTYVGAIENSTDFGHRILAEAVRRGILQSPRVVAITDGAAYNKTILDEHFPKAVRILDLYHAREHLADFVRDVCRLPLDGPLHRAWRAMLDAGHVEKLLAKMRWALPRSGPRRKEGLKQIGYFRDNARAMRYAEFRRMGLFVGSGVIEAGCRTVIGQRLKHSGMFWTVAGANAIIALRCCLASKRFEQFWEDSA